MGICYTVILMDEFDWDYVGTSKEQKKKEFIEAWKSTDKPYEPELVGEWYGFMVWDLDKRYPLYDPYKDIIKRFSDCAWYIPDNAFYDLQKVE